MNRRKTFIEKSVSSFDESNIAYRIIRSKSENPFLIFLHGFSNNSSIWARIIELFNDNYSILCVDLCGHGKSQVGRKRHDFTVNRMSDDLSLIIAAEQITSCILVGHSLGGMIALQYVIKNNQDHVKSLILISTANSNPLKYQILPKAELLTRMLKIVCIMIGVVDHSVNNKQNIYFDYSIMKCSKSLFVLVRNIMHNRIHVLMWSLIAMFDFDISPQAAFPNIPVLIISASKDKVIASRAVVELRQMLENAVLHVVDSRDHLNPIRNARELHGAIDAFINKLK